MSAVRAYSDSTHSTHYPCLQLAQRTTKQYTSSLQILKQGCVKPRNSSFLINRIQILQGQAQCMLLSVKKVKNKKLLNNDGYTNIIT